MKILASFFCLLAFALTASSAPAAARNWNRAIAATPAGGYLIGNPAAPVKVIEFFSLTCPHCRHFAQEGMPVLRSAYVAGGKVSIEIRNFVLNPPDLAASILMRCGAAAQAVKWFETAFADQDALFAGARDLSGEAIARIDAVPMPQRSAALAREAGIDRWFQAHGLPAGRASKCLSDERGEKRLVALRDAGTKQYDIKGTPSFVVNGTVVDGGGWEQLEPAIKAALATPGKS